MQSVTDARAHRPAQTNKPSNGHKTDYSNRPRCDCVHRSFTLFRDKGLQYKCTQFKMKMPGVDVKLYIVKTTRSIFKKILVEANMVLLSLKKDSRIVKGSRDPNDLTMGLH